MARSINQEQQKQLQAEFGQEGDTLGSPRVRLSADSGVHAEFGDGESDMSAWAWPKSTRIDTGGLTLMVSQDRLLLLRRMEPYPVKRWEVLYDSDSIWDVDLV